MDYEKHYNRLIDRAKNRKLECYTEKHHIVPKCLGGSDDKSNIAELTAREHFIAHQLLVKMNPDNYGLISAVSYMTCGNAERMNNRLYGWVREKLSEKVAKLQSGKKNSQFGTKWIHNIEKRECKKVAKHSPIPNGWEIGRIINFDLLEKTCHHCSKKFTSKRNVMFCSEECKKESTKTKAMKIIDLNLDYLISCFEQNKSIDKTLKDFGVKGSRSGNAYFSKILKERGYVVLRRRNTAPLV